MSIITIVGAGWLGWPLAQHLAQQHAVFASKTRESGLAQFLASPVSGFVADLSDPNSQIEKDLIEQQSDVVIGCFPPGFRSGRGDEYLRHWQRLVAACQIAKVDKLVMISTTGVYPDRVEVMSEESSALNIAQSNKDFSDKSRMLLEAEQAVIDSTLNYVIIRSGGLFGPGRHPARFAAKLKSVSNTAPANMIFLTDIIRIIDFAQQSLDRQLINAVAPLKPSKAEFYRAALEHAGRVNELPPVVDIADKAVSCDKLLATGFQFQFPSPIDALPYC